MKYWKYIIIGLLSGIMLFHFSALFYIRNQNYELTSPDYYQKELKHEALLQALRLGQQFQWELDLPEHQPLVLLKAKDPAGHWVGFDWATIQLDRPNHAKSDQLVQLSTQGDGLFQGQLVKLQSGRWNCLITAEYQGQAVAYQQKLHVP